MVRMTKKLEEIRDELAATYQGFAYPWRREEACYIDGFNAAVQELMPVVEAIKPFLEPVAPDQDEVNELFEALAKVGIE